MASRLSHATSLNLRENPRHSRSAIKRVSPCGGRSEAQLRCARRPICERGRFCGKRAPNRREWQPVFSLSDGASTNSQPYQVYRPSVVLKSRPCDGFQDLADAVASGLGGTNVYLIGMMGSGKSTVGSVLAERLSYLFMDTDAVIEQAAKCSIEEIFQLEGEDGFRDIESAALRDLHQYKKLVVGTGGGMVLRPMNWSYLHQGVVVFLNGSPENLAPRVAKDGLSGRPLLSKTDADNIDDPVEIARQKLKRIYAEREKLYKSADLEISLEDPLSENGLASVDEVVRRVLERLNQRLESAKKEREAKGQYEIHGTSDLPGGGSTINAPLNQDAPKGFEPS